MFALIVLAHLQSQRVRENEDRLEWKRRITRNLLERDIDETRRWKVQRLLDWLLDLPIELNEIYWSEVKEWKERKVMPFVTGLERMLEEKGRGKGLEEGERIGLLKGLEFTLKMRFNEAGKAFAEELKDSADISKLQCIFQAIGGAETIEDLRKLL